MLTSAGAVIDGAVVSVMVTVWVSVASLPTVICTVHVTVVLPTGNPPSGASLVTLRLGSAMSLTSGVASVMVVVSGPVASVLISAGAVMDGAPVSVIVTCWVSIALFPESSVAVHVTVVLPTGNPPGGASLVTVGDGSSSSVTTGKPSGTKVNSLVASKVISAGAVIEGVEVSVIVIV